MPSLEEAWASLGELLEWESFGNQIALQDEQDAARALALAVLEEMLPTDCTDTDCEETLTCREHHRIRAQIEILGKEG